MDDTTTTERQDEMAREEWECATDEERWAMLVAAQVPDDDAMRRAAREYMEGLRLPYECNPFRTAEEAHLAGQRHATEMIEGMTRLIAEMTEDQGAKADWIAHADAIARGDWSRFDQEV